MGELALRFRDGSVTHPGRVREVNEDGLLVRPREGLWAVADGMGGHVNGQWAARTIVSALEAVDLPDDFSSAAEVTAEAVHASNSRIWSEGRAQGQSMGSTVVALLIQSGRFAVFWVGDSRCYLFRGGGLTQLTTDHSQVQDLIAAGRLSPDEAEGHPMGHVLSRAVGVEEGLELDAITDEVALGDVFLICSDGLTRVVADHELRDLLGQAQPSAAAEALVSLCLDRGAPDNVTVIVVTCDAATLRTQP